MARTRYFEKNDKAVVRRWQITLDGIRCHMGWGVADGVMRGSSMTLDDEAHALRHFTKKISEKERSGYVEVAPGTRRCGRRRSPIPRRTSGCSTWSGTATSTSRSPGTHAWS
ncbi:WGR domain-containing protein [Spirillospora sp. NPDC048819]|uniref:WGR domain-containing protein n=1 Tax=Spirillospora sp. NPDC048819 TaxID=3155268 RepID=UPI0034073A2A